MIDHVRPALRVPPIEYAIERLFASALLDPDLAERLVREPGPTAVAFGLTSQDAARIAELKGSDLRSLAGAVSDRLYGRSVQEEVRSAAAAIS